MVVTVAKGGERVRESRNLEREGRELERKREREV